MLSEFVAVKVCGLRLRLFNKIILQPHFRAQDNVAYAWYNPICEQNGFEMIMIICKWTSNWLNSKHIFTKKIVYFVIFSYIISFSGNFFYFCNNDVQDCITSTGTTIKFPQWQRGISVKDARNSLVPNLNESQNSLDSVHHLWDVPSKNFIWCRSLGYWVLLSYIWHKTPTWNINSPKMFLLIQIIFTKCHIHLQ